MFACTSNLRKHIMMHTMEKDTAVNQMWLMPLDFNTFVASAVLLDANNVRKYIKVCTQKHTVNESLLIDAIELLTFTDTSADWYFWDFCRQNHRFLCLIDSTRKLHCEHSTKDEKSTGDKIQCCLDIKMCFILENFTTINRKSSSLLLSLTLVLNHRRHNISLISRLNIFTSVARRRGNWSIDRRQWRVRPSSWPQASDHYPECWV